MHNTMLYSAILFCLLSITLEVLLLTNTIPLIIFDATIQPSVNINLTDHISESKDESF